MGQPGYVPAPPPKPPVSGADMAISAVTLVVTALMGAVSAVLGATMLAFLDHCPPASCSAKGAFTAVGVALLVALLIGVAGLTVTIVRLVRRRPAWPFAVATLVFCFAAVMFGGAGYFVAVGG